MATIRLKLEGEAGTIPVQAFLDAVENQVKILQDLDAAISGEPKGTLEWFVADLRRGSLEVITESRPRADYHDIGAEVSRSLITSIEQVETQGTTPPYLSDKGMKSVQRLLNTVGPSKASGLLLASPSEGVEFTVTARAAANIKQLLPVRSHALGSVEGRVEMINIHGGSRFVVYEAHTLRAITCKFDRQNGLESVRGALGKRVNVSGIVHSNARGEPLRMDVEDIRILRDRDKLPSIESIAGIDPDFTGALSTKDYLRSLSLA